MSDPQQPPPNQPGGNPPPPPGGQPPPPPPPGGQPPPPPGGGYPPPPPPPPGGQPPPGGGYPPPPPPPPGGGYPPPPPGGGYPPPPPPPPGGGYGPPSGPGLSVGAAISYGWDKFKGNWGTWVGVTLVFWVIQAALQGIDFAASSNTTTVSDGGFSYSVATGNSVLSIVVLVVSTLVSYLMQAAQTRGGLQETTGNKPSFGDFFNWGDKAGKVILTLLLLGVLTFVGILLCVLPGIIFTFFAWYTLWFVLDQNMSPIEALQASFKLVGSNFGPVLLLALALIGINIVGACLCGIGLLVTIPLSLIATGYSYKFLTGQPVA